MPTYPTSSFRALVEARCPRCHQGHMFSAPLHKLTHFAEMPAVCPACGCTYEPEPGFYYGSMFISFAFSVATFLTVGFITYLLGHNPEVWVYVTAVTVAITLLTPLSYRASRALMLHLFGGIDFNPVIAEQVADGTYQPAPPRAAMKVRPMSYSAPSPLPSAPVVSTRHGA